MSEEYLSHHGIFGQKWGIRRFQNADGSLTDAGRQRYNTGRSKPSYDEMKEYAKNKAIEKQYKKAKLQNINSVNEVANLTTSNVSNARNVYSDYKKSKLPPVETDHLSTRELQEAVNRMNLEDNYRRLTQNRQLAKQGKDYVEYALDSLDEIADLAKIAAAVATIITLAKK